MNALTSPFKTESFKPSTAVPLGSAATARAKFNLEPFETIRFEAREEWLVKRILPRQGIVAVYGASQSFKSFLVAHLAMYVALGWDWAGRRVEQSAAVYIAAEGAAGLRKRKVGFELTHAERLPDKVPFFLISASPNLGTEQGDLAALISAVETAKVVPGLIIIDTLAQSIGAGDENDAGMIQFVANATALANHFRACVVVVHHVGLSADKRMRRHSSLLGGVDAQILAERKEGALSTTITLQKLKDEASNLKLTAHLTRVVVGTDEDGEAVSTLIIERIEDGDGGEPASGVKPAPVPPARRLLMDMARTAILEAGEDFRPYENGPICARRARRRSPAPLLCPDRREGQSRRRRRQVGQSSAQSFQSSYPSRPGRKRPHRQRAGWGKASVAAVSGTFSNLSRSPSASGRAGHPGHAYNMLSRLSRFPTLFRRDRPGQMSRMSRMSRLSENCRGVETDQVRPERRKGCFEGLRGPHFSLDVASRLSGGAARAESPFHPIRHYAEIANQKENVKCVGTESATTINPCTTAAATVAKGSILPASRAGFAIASNRWRSPRIAIYISATSSPRWPAAVGTP
jgi:AAA domain